MTQLEKIHAFQDEKLIQTLIETLHSINSASELLQAAISKAKTYDEIKHHLNDTLNSLNIPLFHLALINKNLPTGGVIQNQSNESKIIAFDQSKKQDESTYEQMRHA